MPLYDFNVNRDLFEAKEQIGLCFPCCCCIHCYKLPTDEPCNVCDHNLSAKPED